MKKQGAEHDLYTFMTSTLIHPTNHQNKQPPWETMGLHQSPMVDPHFLLSILSITRVGMSG